MSSPVVMAGVEIHATSLEPAKVLSASVLARRSERKKMKGWTPGDVDYSRKDAVRFLRMNPSQRQKKDEAVRFGVSFPYPKKWSKKISAHIFKKFPDLNPLKAA